MINEREIACAIVSQFEKTKKRLDEIEAYYLTRSKPSTNQTRHIKNLTSGTLRHRSLLDWYTTQLFKGSFARLQHKVKIILRLSIYEILFMDNIPEHATVNEYVKLTKSLVNQRSANLVNAILRGILRQRDALTFQLADIKNNNLALYYSFPQWMINRWISAWGKEFTIKLCDAFNQIPEFKIRINRTKISAEAFEQLLIENEIIFNVSDKIEGFYKIKHFGALLKAGLLEQGLCSVQDESAAIPVKLLNLVNHQTFLDVCAAPGGKFTQALEETPGLKLAVAVDSDINRLKKVKQNLSRLGLRRFIVAADARNLPFKITFDKILIDAPCSGLGVIRKHPDIKWRRSEKEIQEFSKLQQNILHNVTMFLDKKGQLVYSTCSIEPAENEQVVSSLDKKDFEICPLSIDSLDIKNNVVKTYPSIDKMDGSFACKIKNASN